MSSRANPLPGTALEPPTIAAPAPSPNSTRTLQLLALHSRDMASAATSRILALGSSARMAAERYKP